MASETYQPRSLIAAASRFAPLRSLHHTLAHEGMYTSKYLSNFDTIYRPSLRYRR